jgi:hypothetical protein
MRRILIGGVALATLAIPTAALVATGPAFAVVKKSIPCTTVTGTLTGSVTITGCKVPLTLKKKYVSASAPNSSALATGGTLTWSPAGTTTILGAPTTSTGTLCPAGDTDVIAKGVVTGGTAKVTGKGQKYGGEFCIDASGNVSVAPGTKFLL